MHQAKSAHKKLPNVLKWTIRVLPLAGACATVFFNPSLIEQQLMVLVVLVWAQVYFIFELFLAGK